MKSKIGVLCSYSFPEGMAPTTRIIAYGNGLVQNGCEVEVVINSPYCRDSIKKTSGEIKGLKYRYPFLYNTKLYPRRWYRWLYANWMLYIKCLIAVIKSNREKRYNCVLLSFDTPRDLIVYGMFLRLFGIRTVFIGDEFPEEIRRLKGQVSRHNIILYKIAYRFISGRVLMTRALREYYDNIVCKKPSFILSSVIDTSRFDSLKIEVQPRNYLCYMGNLMLAKDNVDNIIRAFYLIKDKYPNLDLFLYGTPNDKDLKIVKDLISELGVEDRVMLKGRAKYDDVPNILANARINVTSQPITKRAEGGFPTKMCEYMLANVPCILTDAGEITNYVQDGVTAYIVERCNPDAYAKKLDYILSNYKKALVVAENARKYVLDNFGSKQATSGLVDFIKNQIS